MITLIYSDENTFVKIIFKGNYDNSDNSDENTFVKIIFKGKYL